MANVSAVKLCPYCQTEILTTDQGSPERCHSCQKVIKKPEGNIFSSPDYIHRQEFTLLEKLRGDKLNSDGETYIKEMENITVHKAKWYRESLHLDRVAAMCDALGVMQNLVYSKSNGEELKQVINLAKTIGMLANTIDNFYKAGAATYDREIRPIRTESFGDEGDNSAAAFGGNT